MISLKIEVTQKKDEPGGGIAKLLIRMQKQIGGILRKKTGFMVRKVRKIRPKSYLRPLRRNGTDVQKDISFTKGKWHQKTRFMS